MPCSPGQVIPPLHRLDDWCRVGFQRRKTAAQVGRLGIEISSAHSLAEVLLKAFHPFEERIGIPAPHRPFGVGYPRTPRFETFAHCCSPRRPRAACGVGRHPDVYRQIVNTARQGTIGVVSQLFLA